LNTKQREQFITALKSGEYKQCRGALCREVSVTVNNREFRYTGYCAVGLFEHLFGRYARRDELNPLETQVLMTLNDNLRWDFERIANYLESGGLT